MPPIRLFISYRSLDSAKVDALVTRLRSLKNADGSTTYEVWQDKFGIPPGKDWWESIVDAIIDCNVFVFMVSRESVMNVNCRAELSYARKRNRPIIPIALEGEFSYNAITGKNDVTYWSDIPSELNDTRAQFLFYEGVSFLAQLDTAIVTFAANPQRWTDMPAPKPRDPRSATDVNNTMAVVYDQACDYALRLEAAMAERLFMQVVNAGDPDFADESREWITILRDYMKLVEFDARATTRHKAEERWPSYAQQFPKRFIPTGSFDPKDLASRYEKVQQLPPSATGANLIVPVPGSRKDKLHQLTDQQRLLTIMLDIKRPPAERAKAGQDINQYGDPRPGVIDFDFGAGYWCGVPAGKFMYQEDSNASIDYDYRIGKYPITYAQYKAFLDDPNGYRNPQWWKGLNIQGLKQQKTGTGAPRWKFPNHPAENVSWYDAMAFCAWLNTKLTLDQVLKFQSYIFRLPTEREWEKAARGTDGRQYPWGIGYQIGYANINETYKDYLDSCDLTASANHVATKRCLANKVANRDAADCPC